MNERKLVNTTDMFTNALKGGYGIGAFNINNMEALQAVIEACETAKAPVIIQTSAGAMKYAGIPYVKGMIQAALETSTIPIALHLDHGPDFETCKLAIDSGWSSVMIDASHHSLEENIAITRQVVDYAHPRGVTVEAELGRLAGVEDDVDVSDEDSIYTNPAEAARFVRESGCDSLAVAIGTSHGAVKFKDEPKLDFDRLSEIHEAVGTNVPLVLHGASNVPAQLVSLCNDHGADIADAKGVPDYMLQEATRRGVAKVNVDTDLRLAFTGSIRKVFASKPQEFDPRKYLGPGKATMKELITHKIQVLGCADRA